MVLVLSGTGVYLWHDRDRTLKEASVLASQRVLRLTDDLQQALALAQTIIQEVDAQIQTASDRPFERTTEHIASVQADLLASLPLPFEIHTLGSGGGEIALVGVPSRVPGQHQGHAQNPDEPMPGGWSIDEARESDTRRILPLSWRAAPNLHGITGYGVDLDLDSLQKRLERELGNTGDRASLFRLNKDGTAALLAQSPHTTEPVDMRTTADWISTAQQSQQGPLGLTTELDGQQRQVAFRRLSAPADQLAVVYSTATRAALASWHARWPYMVGLALLLAAGMAEGGRRLNRSLRALSKSERQFQLALSAGNIWDWDLETNTMRYSANLFDMVGRQPLPQEPMAQALFRLMLPEDAQRLEKALREHLKLRGPYSCWFRIRDANGKIRWFDSQGQAFWNKQGRATYMAGTTFEFTERRELEETQRQTLQLLDTVANASAVLFWTSDLQGRRDWINQRWLAFTGSSTEQPLGDGWMTSVHPEDMEHRHQATLPVDATQTTVIEYRLLHRNGSYRSIVEQILPRFDADQVLIGHIGSCVDITELREAEAAVRQRGALLERVFDVLQDMLFVVDARGRFLHIQGHQEASMHAPPERLLGRTIREVMSDDHATLIHHEMELARNGQLRDFDYALDLPVGRRQFNARVARMPDSDQYMFVARDTTEREILKQQRERLQQLLMLQLQLASRFINQPLDSIDAEIDRALGEIGAFVHADRAYIFSYNLDSQSASNSHEWCASGIEPAINQLQDIRMDLIPDWVAAHQQQKAFMVEDVEALPVGPLRDILEPQGICNLITLPMLLGGNLLGFVGFDSVRGPHIYDREEIHLLQLFAQMLVNVRERQRSEAQLQAFAAQLEQRVTERTSQLDSSVKGLSQANRELKSFAYSVSHDLKSPLRSMEGFASLLLEKHQDGLDPQARHYLERIQNATLHMARLIRDLLAYAHIEQFEQGLTSLNLVTTVNDVLKSMRSEIEAQGAQIEVNIAPSVAVVAHPEGLAMASRNLIDNALKFAPEGMSPVIRIQATADGQLVRLSVADQGQGFDMRYHDLIFALFQRLQRPYQTPGTGIGLAMVHKAIERMDGRVWAESAPGQGATFHIELPHG